MLQVRFDDSKVSKREAQIINALVSTYLSLAMSIKGLRGVDVHSPTIQAEAGRDVARALGQFFPDLHFSIVDEP